ncbi:MAG: RNA polymerase sigma factor [Lysobacterales bacterium]
MDRFDTTRWSLVLHARHASQGARAALDSLCRTYRPPILAYIRRRGYAEDAAEDLAQTFFARFVEHAYHATADPARGRFRAFLLTAVKRFLIDCDMEQHALKRGGQFRFEPLDVVSEARIAGVDDPEMAFERDWAVAVLDAALARLRAEARQAGRLALFDDLLEFLTEAPDEADYARVAAAHGLRRNTLAVAVHRLRQRLREVVREEISDTAANHIELEQELRDLRVAFHATMG